MRSKALAGWHRHQYTVQTDRGPTVVDGITNGPFGIHLRDGFYADVTHLLSGRRVPHGRFCDLGKALAFCEQILPLASWVEPGLLLTPSEQRAVMAVYDAVAVTAR